MSILRLFCLVEIDKADDQWSCTRLQDPSIVNLAPCIECYKVGKAKVLVLLMPGNVLVDEAMLEDVSSLWV